VIAGQRHHFATPLAHALLLLTEFGDQRALLLSDLDDRLDGAVEEIVALRLARALASSAPLTTDYTMNGQDYRKGDRVMLSYYSANRDETVFAAPERFRYHPRRAEPSSRASAGAGPHFCLGNHLARLELTIMLAGTAHPASLTSPSVIRTYCGPVSPTESSAFPATFGGPLTFRS